MFARLPGTLSSHLHLFLDYKEVAQSVPVCKHWRTVLKSANHLWLQTAKSLLPVLPLTSDKVLSGYQRVVKHSQILANWGGGRYTVKTCLPPIHSDRSYEPIGV